MSADPPMPKARSVTLTFSRERLLFHHFDRELRASEGACRARTIQSHYRILVCAGVDIVLRAGMLSAESGLVEYLPKEDEAESYRFNLMLPPKLVRRLETLRRQMNRTRLRYFSRELTTPQATRVALLTGLELYVTNGYDVLLVLQTASWYDTVFS